MRLRATAGVTIALRVEALGITARPAVAAILMVEAVAVTTALQVAAGGTRAEVVVVDTRAEVAVDTRVVAAATVDIAKSKLVRNGSTS